MVENIEIKQKELKQLLTDYYKKKNNDESIKIDFETNEELVGIYENKSIVTRIILKQHIALGNQIVSKEREISEEELKDVFNEILIEQDYEVINIILNNEKQYVGYYEDVNYAFKGLKLNVKKRQMQKVKR